MRKLLCKSGIGIGLALVSSAALAATQEELLGALLGQIQMYVLIAFVIVVIAGVYFMRSRDKRQTPLNEIFEERRAIHSVGPNASITECVRLMTAGKIGGAGFDVLTVEPPKQGNILLDLKLPNLIVTPHVAWASREAMQILADQLIDNVEAFAAGKPQNVVES